MNNQDPSSLFSGDNGLRNTARDTMLVAPGNAQYKLVRINDGFAGETFPLVEHINTIGRIDENTILLSHKSISRNHAQIIRNGSLHRLVDLDSSNGTFYNGKRVHRAYPVDLAENSIIQFGSIEFVFAPIDEQVDPKSYNASPTKWLFIAAMGILFLLIVAGASLAFTLFKSDKPQPDQSYSKLSVEEKTKKLIEIGKQQIAQGNWRAATKTFETISAILPNNTEASRLRQRSQLELEAQQTYDRAGDALEAGDLTGARNLMRSIQPGTEAKKRALRQLPHIEAKLANRLVSEARTLMDFESEDELKRAYTLLTQAARLEPDPKPKSKTAILDLRALYRKKHIPFKPIDLSSSED